MSTQLVQVDPRSAALLQEIPHVPQLPSLSLLRLSVTDHCNFRCRYCMPGGGIPRQTGDDLLSMSDLASLVTWLSIHAKINRVRITGGEPLVRPGLSSLIAEVASLPGIREVSLTTNASLLAPMAAELKASGLSRVNISLDTLNADRFREITRGGVLSRTLAGISTAQAVSLGPIKLNTVLQRSTWQQEVPRLLDYAADTGLEIRFIELMRMGTERKWCESEFISVDEVRRGLGVEIVPAEERSSAPALKTSVAWRGAQVAVGWICPRSHPFCSRCERLRMDAHGQVRRCLMDPATLNLTCVLRGHDSVSAQQSFQSYIKGKLPPRAMESSFAMSQIGG